MEKVKVLIVEDQSLIADQIALALSKNNVEVTSICKTGEDAVHKFDEFNPDLVLMDIQLAGPLDGIETGEIMKSKRDVPIIILSEFTDRKTVDRSKKIIPENYISKPFQELDLIRAIDLAIHKHNLYMNEQDSVQKSILLKEGHRYIKIFYDDVILIKADRSYCHLYTEKASFTFSKSMNTIASQLNHPSLLRVHRSFMVNVTKISSVEGNMIKLGSHQAELSRGQRESFLTKFKLLK